jgi:hypothetical protein
MGKRYLPEYNHTGFAGLRFTMYPDIPTSSVREYTAMKKRFRQMTVFPDCHPW